MASKWRLAILIAGILGALWGADVFLARSERAEVFAEARTDYEDGMRLRSQGRTTDAVQSLRKAHALDRSNHRYALQLAAFLMEVSKLDEADRLLSDLLTRSPNDGEANLAEARLLGRRGEWENAFAYYHRAIYGSWESKAPSEHAAQSISVRLELANLLAQRNLRKDLLAEVLALETEATNDPQVLRTIARLYLIAGSPARAEAVYRGLLRVATQDSDLNIGLGDAELAHGNYRAATAAFQDAIRSGADRNVLAQRIQLAASVAELDPTVRRLTSMEKFNRSVRILKWVVDALKLCGQGDAIEMASAEKLLAARVHSNPANELAEERLSTAEHLWQIRIRACGLRISAAEEPLRLVMTKIAQ